MGQVIAMQPPITKPLSHIKARAELIGPVTRLWDLGTLSLAICVDISANPPVWALLSQKYDRKLHGTSTEFEKRCWLQIINSAEQHILKQLYNLNGDDNAA